MSVMFLPTAILLTISFLRLSLMVGLRLGKEQREKMVLVCRNGTEISQSIIWLTVQRGRTMPLQCVE